MRMDPLLSLTLALSSKPGIYAVLLGSGISRPAGIPTGWDIVEDLICQVAQLRGEPCTPDPATWYAQTFGEEPDYAVLLRTLAKTPTERNHLLRSYFEPTDEERTQGLKEPTRAHHALAALVKMGLVRVLLTTNFGRLIERALEMAGVHPVVIGTPDAIRGAEPLAHTSCLLLKVHGDYLDTRFLNTPEELAKYTTQVNRLLAQIFNDYGLIVCGWSATWDTALRQALERASSRRYTTYWLSPRPPSTEA